MKFHSPYQFIPVNTQRTPKTPWEDIVKAKHEYIRHDRWASDGISARIHCKITTLSPLVVGAKQEKGSEKKPGSVASYCNNNGDPAIPANSLRGMVASLTESISQSSMRVFNTKENSYYSVRKPPKADSLKHIGLLLKQDDGWFIYHLPEHIRIAPKDAPTDSYQHKECQEFYYADRNGAETKVSNASLTPDPSKEKGIVYIRGVDIFPSKEYENFIPWDGTLSHKCYPVSQEILEGFNSILKKRFDADSKKVHMPKGYENRYDSSQNKRNNDPVTITRSGDLIYYRQENNRVVELSYSAIWRKASGNLYDQLQRDDKDALPWGKGRIELTPAECLFGVVEEDAEDENNNRSLASRIAFSDAESIGNVSVADEPITLKKLDSPKLPSPSMYFSAANGGFIKKEDLDLSKHKLNGRKLYIPHNQRSLDEKVWESCDQFSNSSSVLNKQKHKKRWNQHLQAYPVPSHSEFGFFIDVENLQQEEYDLLLTALEPADNNQPFVHRLGLGKPYGLGQIQLDITHIDKINRQQRYSLKGLKQARSETETSWVKIKNNPLIDSEALHRLQLLGNPVNLGDDPVCYPFQGDDAYSEENGYQWFETNQKLKSGNQWLAIAKHKIKPLKSN